MDPLALEKSLQRQVTSPVYLFYGEETYLMEQALRRFEALVPEEVRDFNLDLAEGRDMPVQALVNVASTLPFMADKRVVIVRNAEYFKARRKAKGNDGQSGSESDREEKTSSLDEVLLNYLENPPDTTCLIFCTDSVDRKRKLYKAIEKKGQVVEFAPLKGRELNEWINQRARKLGKVIEPAAMAGLITAIGNNLQQLSTELEKLACYSVTEKITAADVESMVSRTAELSVFELVDAIGERKYQKAIKMAREMVFLGEPVIRLLSMVARQFRLLLRTKSLLKDGFAAKDITGQLQVHPFVAQKCVKQAANFTLQELMAGMEKILRTDADIKNGRQEPVLALELLIVGLGEKKSGC